MLSLFERSGIIRPGEPFLKLLRELMRPEFNFVKLIIVNSVGISMLSLVLPVSVQAIITNLGILNQTQPIMIMTVVLFVVLLFSGSIQTLQTYTLEILRRRLFLRFGGELLNRVLEFENDEYSSLNRNLLAKRYTDVLLMQSSMVVFFVDGIGFGFQYLLTGLLLCLYHPYFIIFGIGITVLLWLSWYLFGPKGVAAGSPEADTRYEVMGWVDEVMRARPVFMTSQGQDYAERRFVELSAEWSEKRNNLFRQQFLQTISLQIINALVYTSLVGLGYLLVRQGELSVGQLVAAFIVVTMLLSSLPRLQNFYTSVYDFSTNLDKLAEFWRLSTEKSGAQTLEPGQGLELELKDLRFSEDVELNFNLRRSEKAFFHVESFAAARFLNRLLEGNLNPISGDLRINGVRLSDLHKRSLREHIEVIALGRVFSATVFENLTLQQFNAQPLTEIEDALEAVGLLERVRALPQGIHTRLLPNGYPLSMSETLALQIARAILSKPGLIIVTLDFDKISPQRRLKVTSVILDQTKTWTVIFLTQRSYPQKFDRYLILDRNQTREFSTAGSLQAEVQNNG